MSCDSVHETVALLDAIRDGAQRSGLAELPADLAAIAARTLAFEARDRYPSVDAARLAIADAQRSRAPAGAGELGQWVRARLAAGR